ncbi:MAG: hypothetical protein K5755_06445, partial [Clostridiales bacterium]|nr:hypothetical protein [Clostridiales bacterium]
MKNKKVLRLIALFAMICIMVNASALVCFATGESADIIVTIANKGAPVVYNHPLNVTDADNDGALTINDALILAHSAYYSEGAAGYETTTTQWGLSITKLWGNTNKGSFGYYVNNVSAWSLTDPITDGDYLYAFCYKDAANYTDNYSYFNITEISSVVPGEPINLSLTMLGYDESWNTVQLPAAGAIITLDGVDTQSITDETGVASIVINDSYQHIISARFDDKIITPAVIDVKGNSNHLLCNFSGNKYYYFNNIVQTGTSRYNGIDYVFGADGAMTNMQTDAYVTIANNGAPVACYAPIIVNDADNDLSLTINDALICAHEQYYSDGVNGYESAVGQYGLGVTKLWGNTNKGSFGYYVNNVSAWSLTDNIGYCDEIYAFCYQDAANWTDSYSFFNSTEVYFGEETTEFTFTLSRLGYDENWNTVELPVANAIITFDGVDTEYVTDENGEVTLTVENTTHIISARSNDFIITPPVILVNPDETGREFTGDFNGNTYWYKDGVVQTGFKTVDGKNCYFGADGAMVKKQLVTINGKKYYFGKDGAMYTKRLISVSGKKY